MIGEVIAQFYSLLNGFMTLRETVGTATTLSRSLQTDLLQQLSELEGEYKSSQEWVMTRDTQDIRVGVVGTEHSLKSALVAAFTDGELDLEGDEPDGRAKTKLTVDGRCHLLLVREETGGPSKQLSLWADVLVYVFSYASSSSLTQIGSLYIQMRDVKEDVPVMLVGVKGDQMPVEVNSGMVKRVVESMEKCHHRDVQLSENAMQSINDLFLKVCRLALTGPTLSSVSLPTTSIPQSPSHTSLKGLPPASPSQNKRRKKQKSKQGSYNIQKQMLTESLGSGRHIPVKEGPVKKKSSGMRPEWKKKYLVLSQTELTYYPTLTDYMQQGAGKKFNLKHITVKVPNKHFPVARATTTPPTGVGGVITIDQTDSLLNDSDNSPSLSPTPPTPVESCLDYYPTAPLSPVAVDRGSLASALNNQPHTDQSDESSSSRQHPNVEMVTNGRGHSRNNSVDEVLLKMRSTGLSFTEEERPSTLSRVHRGRVDKPRAGFLSVLVPSSEDMLSESPGGSSESIGGRKKHKESRDSMYLERNQSAADKERKGKMMSSGNNHKRQRSWGGNKGENENPSEPVSESAEFQVISLDGKVWELECLSPEEMAQWVRVIEEQIKKIYSENVSHKRMNSSCEVEKKGILDLEGNNECADCGQTNPEWASINHGCLLCIECSGIHRKMGAHVSRIRSLTLDEWSSELVAIMLAMGNKKHHQIWEARKPRSKPSPTSSREERETFIRAKYIAKDHLFILPPSSKDISQLLLTAVKSAVIENVMRILPYANQDDIDRLHGNSTALHQACIEGNTSIVQLLIWSRANINQLDIFNRPPLYYARQYEHSVIETILIASNCVVDNLSRLSLSSDSGSTEALIRTRSS